MTFTRQITRDFQSFDGCEYIHTDKRTGINFCDTDIYNTAMELLHFNCPDKNCSYKSGDWDKLSSHVKQVHNLSLW